jgi:hypothetical protein
VVSTHPFLLGVLLLFRLFAGLLLADFDGEASATLAWESTVAELWHWSEPLIIVRTLQAVGTEG